MYAGEYATASVLQNQILSDLNLATVQVGSTDSSGSPKIYDNFGALVGINKIFGQDFDKYDPVSGYLSYRMSLALYLRAFLWGGTVRALNIVGAAVSGVNPIVVMSQEEKSGWKLKTVEAVITGIFPSHLLLDHDIPRIGRIVYVDDTTPYHIGQTIVISWSKLGTNTKLRSNQWDYNGSDVHVFLTAAADTPSVEALMKSAINNVVPARVAPRVFFHHDYVAYRPVETGSINQYLEVDPVYGYVTNSQQLPLTGVQYTTQVLTLPAGYQTLDWWFDWLTLELDDVQKPIPNRPPEQILQPTAIRAQDL